MGRVKPRLPRRQVGKRTIATNFRPVLSTDTAGKVAYVRLRPGRVTETREILPRQVFGDFDADGVLVGVEILA